MKQLLYILMFLLCKPCAGGDPVIRVGAKHFNEGYILSEIIAQLLEDNGFTVERVYNLGGTAVIFEALRTGAIDVYPEYTGTLSQEILHLKNENGIGEKLKNMYGLEISGRYGFTNTYALLVPEKLSRQLGLKKISDLVPFGELRTGFSHEFLKRNDGWENLRQFYGLPQTAVGLDHGLAYKAMLENSIDLTDAYSTDGEIKKYGLKVLEDDRQFFPGYYALSMYNSRLPEKAKVVLAKLDGAISQDEMQAMNAAALFEGKSHGQIARGFLQRKKMLGNSSIGSTSFSSGLFAQVLTHLKLTVLALLGAILLGLPLGMWIYRYAVLSKVILYLTGILQTIPSIALLALMIPLLGIGVVPAVVALFLYALLPVLRATVTGLTTIDPDLKKVAIAIGMSRKQQLRLVELPLAMPLILTGIRTAAVISVGTATLAAFIGAGGLGEFIVTGLALNNTSLILTGAVPAAVLAVLIELLFEGIELWLVPRHLRKRKV